MRKWLRRKLHISWHIAWLSLGIVIGIALATRFWNTPISSPLWLLISAGLFTIVAAKRSRLFVIVALAAGLQIGLWRGASVLATTTAYQTYLHKTVVIHATVGDDPTYSHNQAGLKLHNISIGGRQLGGQVWAGVTSGLELKRSDKVVLAGRIEAGFGSFSASLSHAQLLQIYRPAHADASRAIRDAFTAGLKKAVPSPEADLGIGYLTGQHNTLSEELTKQLELVGLIHLVIAGGYNVTILVRFVRRRFMKLSRYLALLSSGLLLLGFTIMTGFVAPMARTAVVTGLSLLAWYYGRKFHPLVLLPFSAAITALAAPSFVQGDVGWYMTFVAYGGLTVLGPLLKRYFWGNKSSGIIKQILVDTISVQIVTMPLMAFAFKQYSIYGVPANLLILPLMPLTILAVAIGGLGGMILPSSAARIVGWPAAQLLGYTYKITTWLSSAQSIGASAHVTSLELALTYSLIIALIFILWRKTHYNLRAENMVA